jgi:hypothetical protein
MGNRTALLLCVKLVFGVVDPCSAHVAAATMGGWLQVIDDEDKELDGVGVVVVVVFWCKCIVNYSLLYLPSLIISAECN